MFWRMTYRLIAHYFRVRSSVVSPVIVHYRSITGCSSVGTSAVMRSRIVDSEISQAWLKAAHDLAIETAVAILSVNIVGDLTNALMRRHWLPMIVLPLGVTMLCYLIVKRHTFVL
jgi:hypothetical protein